METYNSLNSSLLWFCSKHAYPHEHHGIGTTILSVRNLTDPEQTFDRQELGRKGWIFLHCLPEHYPESNPSEVEKDEMEYFLTRFMKFYPCPLCSRHAVKGLSSSFNESWLESRDNMKNFIFLFHNYVSLDNAGNLPMSYIVSQNNYYYNPEGPTGFGNSVWSLLHSFCDSYPENPSLDHQKEFRRFIQLFLSYVPDTEDDGDFWPVKLKSGSYSIILPDDNDLSSRLDLCGWCSRNHNNLNVLLGKPVLYNMTK